MTFGEDVSTVKSTAEEVPWTTNALVAFAVEVKVATLPVPLATKAEPVLLPFTRLSTPPAVEVLVFVKTYKNDAALFEAEELSAAFLERPVAALPQVPHWSCEVPPPPYCKHWLAEPAAVGRFSVYEDAGSEVGAPSVTLCVPPLSLSTIVPLTCDDEPRTT